MRAFSAAALFIRSPLKLFTIALLAKIAGDWSNLQESQEGKEFANPILDRSARKTPLICGFQGETRLRNPRGALLYISVPQMEMKRD